MIGQYVFTISDIKWDLGAFTIYDPSLFLRPACQLGICRLDMMHLPALEQGSMCGFTTWLAIQTAFESNETIVPEGSRQGHESRITDIHICGLHWIRTAKSRNYGKAQSLVSACWTQVPEYFIGLAWLCGPWGTLESLMVDSKPSCWRRMISSSALTWDAAIDDLGLFDTSLNIG